MTRKERNREIKLLSKRIGERSEEVVEQLQTIREDLVRRYEGARLYPMSDEDLRLGEH